MGGTMLHGGTGSGRSVHSCKGLEMRGNFEAVGSNLANHHHPSGIDMQNLDNQRGSGEKELLPLSQCRKVFVQRDYSQGLIVRFSAKMPEELQGYIESSVFETTMAELNRMYEEAEKVGARSAMETLFSCFTCYLAQLCITNQYDKALRRIGKFLREQNESVYMPRGLFISDPVERGLRVVEVSILTEPAAPPRGAPGTHHQGPPLQQPYPIQPQQ